MNRSQTCGAAAAVTLVVMLFSGCASSGKAVAELDPGMPTQQVLDILGPPADRSFRGSDEAWQYQEVAGFGAVQVHHRVDR